LIRHSRTAERKKGQEGEDWKKWVEKGDSVLPHWNGKSKRAVWKIDHWKNNYHSYAPYFCCEKLKEKRVEKQTPLSVTKVKIAQLKWSGRAGKKVEGHYFRISQGDLGGCGLDAEIVQSRRGRDYRRTTLTNGKNWGEGGGKMIFSFNSSGLGDIVEGGGIKKRGGKGRITVTSKNQVDQSSDVGPAGEGREKGTKWSLV